MNQNHRLSLASLVNPHQTDVNVDNCSLSFIRFKFPSQLHQPSLNPNISITSTSINPPASKTSHSLNQINIFFLLFSVFFFRDFLYD